MRLKLVAVALLAASTLVACTMGQQEATISALEVGLATAETAGTAYKQLPACAPTAATKVCSDQSHIAALNAADNKAYATIKAAEAVAATGANVDLTAAAAALTAFQGLIATLPK